MASTTWRINSIDTDGHALALSRIQPWGANGAINPVSVTSTLEPLTGDVGNLIVDDITECTFAAADVRKPGFAIVFTFSESVDLWGFRFVGPNEQTWPMRHAISDSVQSASVGMVHWVYGTLSPAPSRAPSFYQPTGVWVSQTAAGTKSWRSCAVSADGRVLLAVANSAQLVLSKDGGNTWGEIPGAGSRAWYGGAVSANGQVLMAVVGSGNLWLSKDGGDSWTELMSVGTKAWRSCAVSSDGQVLLAVANSAQLVLSKDGGTTWSEIPGAGSRQWYGCAVSASGDVLMAVAGGAGEAAVISKDRGESWAVIAAAGARFWYSCAVSEDGQYLIAGASGALLTSGDGGATWVTQTSASEVSWWGVDMSSDGRVQMAAGITGYIRISLDYGVTWVQQEAAGSRPWYSCSVSKDGTFIVSTINGTGSITTYVFADPIYQPVTMRMSAVTVDAAIKGADSLPQGWGAIQKVDPFAFADMEFGGNGHIYGSVELYSQAGNIRLPRRVRLHRSRDGLLVRETWSDIQGNYRFEHISERYTYDVIAWDHEGSQQSVVANDLTPELMS